MATRFLGAFWHYEAAFGGSYRAVSIGRWLTSLQISPSSRRRRRLAFGWRCMTLYFWRIAFHVNGNYAGNPTSLVNYHNITVWYRWYRRYRLRAWA